MLPTAGKMTELHVNHSQSDEPSRGDDPNQDGIYPDPYGGHGAYTGPEDCGTSQVAKVISTR